MEKRVTYAEMSASDREIMKNWSEANKYSEMCDDWSMARREMRAHAEYFKPMLSVKVIAYHIDASDCTNDWYTYEA